MTVLLARQIPVSEAARLVCEHDPRLWRIIRHYVKKAHAQSNWSELKRVGGKGNPLQ